MIEKSKIREFARNLLGKGRNYQPGRTDRGDFKKALIYIMELTKWKKPFCCCLNCKHQDNVDFCEKIKCWLK